MALSKSLRQNFSKYKVGGLSGIDYDAKNDLYYLTIDQYLTIQGFTR
jgi:hypothetical protein